MLSLRPLFVLLLLLVLALPEATSAQLKNKIVGVIVESVRVGDQFFYTVTETVPARKKSVTKRRSIIERVIATDAEYEMKSGARKLIRDTITGNSVYYLESDGANFLMNEPMALSQMRGGGQWKSYPLKIAKGKTIKLPESEQVVDLGSSKSSTKTSTSQSLLGKEIVKVEKKNYNCVKIRETVTIESKSMPAETKKVVKPTSKKVVRTATLWYSPELQTLVKYTTSQGSYSFTQTLTKYVKAPAQTALLVK